MVLKRGGLPAVRILALLVIILFSTSASALNYYADVEIDVGSDGSASITGTTDHPALSVGKTDQYTSKKGAHWLLNITLAEQFSDFIFKVVLPDNAAINYVKAPSQVRISEEGDRLTITGTGHDEKFSVQVQYSLSSGPEESLALELLTWFGPALLLIIVGFALFRLAKRKEKHPGQKPAQGAAPSYNPDTLTDRQKQILDIIKGSKTVVTQAMVEKSVKIPKSSISRNIDSLVRKGILKKEKKGMSNILTLIR